MKRMSWAVTVMVAALCWSAAGQSPVRTDGTADAAPPEAVQSEVINLSLDLVRLGIAVNNLPPDSPSTDARPLFQAALQYAMSHPVRRMTADHDAYYFLTPQDATAYLRLKSLSDLTVDLADSTVYFAGAFLQGLPSSTAST
jgi:hypothetical protein